MDPWRYSTEGISVALRVTPRGGRDDIDGIETLANGRSVVKVRVRAIADGGEANRAVTELLARRRATDPDIWIVEVEDRRGTAGLVATA